MASFRLVRRYLGKHLLRSLLTIGSLVVALFLLCVLQSLVVALDAGVRGSKRDRLIVQSAVSLFVQLPIAYQEKIAQVPGVEKLCKWQWFGGVYKEESNFFAQFAVDPDTLFDCYPDIKITSGSIEAFRSERQGCIIGHQLCDRFKFKLGDTIPLIGGIFPHPGGGAWEFKVAAIYEPTSTALDHQTMFFRWDYFEETFKAATGMTPGVGTFSIRSTPGCDQTKLMAAVEQLFENGPQRVQCTTEAEFQAQFVSMVGNIPVFVSAIGGGVLLAIVLACINTMLMAFREQLHDAGILKAIGFTDGRLGRLMLAQSLLLCGLGGLCGVGLAKLAEPLFVMLLGTMFPGYAVTGPIMGLGLAVTVGIGLVAGVVPALRARSLRVVDALRSVE